MAIPFRPVGIGQVAAKNVFRINFSEALSAIPELHAWDDFNLNTVASKIFTGTAVNSNKPMIGAIGASLAPSASWWPSSSVAGAAVNNASRLKGNDGYCLLSGAAPIARCTSRVTGPTGTTRSVAVRTSRPERGSIVSWAPRGKTPRSRKPMQPNNHTVCTIALLTC